MSQFNFYTLVSLFCSREINAKINKLHHRALQIVYQDASSFNELLIRDDSYSIHHRNRQYLAIEMFKVKIGVAPTFMNYIFTPRDISIDSVISGLRSQTDFYNYNNPKTVKNGLQSLRNLGPQIWNILPSDIKHSDSIEAFKLKIKKWISESCPCRLCKTYVQGLGFVNVVT